MTIVFIDFIGGIFTWGGLHKMDANTIMEKVLL
jgi:hypothetical protein